MKKKKNMILTSGIVGLSAMALAVSPAMAEGATGEVTAKDVVQKVDKDGVEVNLDKTVLTDLGLHSGVFKLGNTDKKISNDDLKVEEVLDDADVVTGEKTILTVENEGEWVFVTNLEGTLVSVDFKLAEGFTGDPSVTYTVIQSDVDAERINETVEDLLERETVETKEKAAGESSVILDDKEIKEQNSTSGTLTLDYPNKEAEKTEKENPEKEASDKKEEVDTKEEKTSEDVEPEEGTKGVSVARTLAAPAAPAAPAEVLPDNFEAPALKVDNASKTDSTAVKFGVNGDALPDGVEIDTLSLSASSDEEIVLNNGKELQQPAYGIWKVEDSGFVFEPYAGFDESSIKVNYTVRNSEGGAGTGTITLNFATADAGTGDNETGNNSSNTPGGAPSDNDNTNTDGNDENGTDDGTTEERTQDGARGGENTPGGTTRDGSNNPAESNVNAPGAVETGAEALSNNSVLYAIAAGIATLMGAAFIFASRMVGREVKNKNN